MKKTSRFLAILLALGMLLSLGACGLNLAGPVLPEDYDSPIEYYRAVETNNAASLLALAQLSSQLAQKDKVFTQGEFQLTLDQSVLDPYLISMVTQAADMDLSWFKSVGVAMLAGTDGDLAQENLTLRLNGSDIISLQTILDKSNLIEYLTVPELNPTSFSMDLGELTESLPLSPEDLHALLNGELLSMEDLTELATRYFGVVMSNLDKVEVSEGTASAGGVEAPCNIAVVTIDGETMLKIAKSALATARYDQKLENLIYFFACLTDDYDGDRESFHEDYDSEIEYYLDNIADLTPEDMDGSLIMTVFIDEEGTILGRSLEVLSEDELVAFLSFTAVPKGSEVGVDLAVSVYSSGSYTYDDVVNSWEEQTVVTLSGKASLSETLNSVTGDFLMNLYALDDFNGERDEIVMDLFDVHADFGLSDSGIQGEAVFTPCEDLMNKLLEELDGAPQPVIDLVKSLTLAIVSRGADGVTDLAWILRTNGSDLLTLGLTCSEAEPFAITVPTDVTDAETWSNSIGPVSLNTILNKLMAAGMPAEVINALAG